ncbi:hypothetical protein FQR65_LT14939 [Abscondita terminalis]|nr:hypothetical protein FQR65_LT14939 [Abscondita terminalis]
MIFVAAFLLTATVLNVSGAPPCNCVLSQSEQSCLLGHLIEVINKLINCPVKSSTTDTTTATETETPTSETEAPVHEYTSTTETDEIEESSTDESTTITTTITTTDLDKCSEESSTKGPYFGSVLTNLKVPLPKEACEDKEKTDYVLVPVLRVEDENKPFDLVNVLKCLFMKDKHICCDYFIRAITTSCSHSFCYHCIVEWRKNNNNCPICREQIRSMAPSRALDNMVEALNVSRVRIGFEGISGDVFETSPLVSMYPSTSSDTNYIIDPDVDDVSIASDISDNDDYVSDDTSNISDEFRSYIFDQDSQEEVRGSSPEGIDITDFDELNDSNSSSDFEVENDTISLEPNDILEFDGSDDDSIFSNYLSDAENMTIKHTIQFQYR